MNKIFKIKKQIDSLSSNSINKKLILYLFLIIILTMIVPSFIFGSDILMVVKKTLEPLNNIHGTEKTRIIFVLIRDLFFMFTVFFFIWLGLIILLNWVIKIILGFFKKEISLYKLLNITLYSILFNRFLIFVLILVLMILYPLIKNISNDQSTPFVLLPLLIINIFTLIFFIYAIKISIKNKTKLINK